MSKSRLPVLYLVSILNFLIITTTTDLVTALRCRPDQTKTLKSFKNEFAFSSSCSDDKNFFRGVICDNTTGAVTYLELPRGCLRGILRPNSSLFQLSHLRYLNLSFNNFASSSLPSSFGQLNNLKVLHLSSNGFIGQIPSSIRNLTKLTKLTLSHNKLTGELPSVVQNLTKLLALDLSDNQFSGTIPSSLITMPFLCSLDLRKNNLIGSFEIPNSTSKLEKLYLGDNLFEAEIIDPVLKLVKLRNLSLSFLNISHPIDLSIFSSLQSLSYLSLNGNKLTSKSVNSDMDFPKNMEILFLLECNISKFPRFLKSLKKLTYLNLSGNRIKGYVPDWLWSLPLVDLILRNNLFTGFEGSLEHVLANSSVQVLDLAFNSFKGSLPNLPVSIIFFSAYNNSFTGNIPLSTYNPTALSLLDLSYNNFTGSIPGCFCNISFLDLRKNKLEGKFPDEFSRGALTQSLDIGYNRLAGKLPRSLLNCSLLKFLGVDHNRINDSFPLWLKKLPNLEILNLRSNRFHGPISPPDDQGPLAFPKLRILEIADNRFTGSLPTNYFANWRLTSFKMNDEESFKMNDEEGLYMGDNTNQGFIYEYTLDLQYKGIYIEQGLVLTFFSAIDFSQNKLEGEIPESTGLLKPLIALNLSNNSFTGHIPMSFTNLSNLESLDLSKNKLSGKIPQELGRLSFLEYVDFSYNQLTGRIPQGTQIVGQPKSSFEGNLGLCGLPLKESCLREDTPSTQEPQEEEEEILKWKAVAIGYGLGVLYGLVIGHVVALYKPDWFIKNYGQNRLRGIRLPY